jgi:hypothetical protein
MARAHFIQFEEGGRTIVEVVLSRRNLLALLHKLDMPGSARMITNNDVRVNGERVMNTTIHIMCENDDEHYAKRDEPPGEMHPDTEEFIQNPPDLPPPDPTQA